MVKKIIEKNCLQTFSGCVKESLNKNNVISEDTIRYIFYAVLIKKLNFSWNNIISIQQELAYSNKILGIEAKEKYLKKNRAKHILAALDTFINYNNVNIAIEFKYHRSVSKNGNKKNIPHALYASEVLVDIFRLSLIKKDVIKLFIYVIDDEMINYGNKKNNCLYRTLLDLKVGYEYKIETKEINKQNKTTKENFKKAFCDKTSLGSVAAKIIYNENFATRNNNYRIIVFEIKTMKI